MSPLNKGGEKNAVKKEPKLRIVISIDCIKMLSLHESN